MPIQNEKQYEEALETVNTLWDSVPGTPEYMLLQALIARIEAYESKVAAMPPGFWQ